MITTLSELVSPMDEGEFRSRLRGRTFTFRRASGSERFDTLLTWSALRQLLAEGAIPPEGLQLTVKGDSVPRFMYQLDKKPDVDKIDALLKNGASIVIRRASNYVPPLRQLSSAMTESLGEAVSVACVVTTGAGGALKLHYDRSDLILLQIEGGKRWRIYSSPVDNLLVPTPPGAAPTGEIFFDEMLGPGDFMFLPSGFWHHCDNGPGRSVHLGFIIEAPTGYHVMRTALQEIAMDELFRRPLSRFPSAEEKAAHEEALRSRLLDRVRTMSLAGAPSDRHVVATPKGAYDD